MATVIGVFDDDDGITKARDALEQAGYGDDVVEVIEQGDQGNQGGGIGVVPLLGGVNQGGGQGGGAVVDPGNYPRGLRDAGISDDEKDFFWRSVNDGAKLIVINTGGADARDIEMLLKQAGAGRVQVDN